MKKDQKPTPNASERDSANWDEQYKKRAPQEFIPTELGSAVFVSVDGQPPDEEFLIENKSKNRTVD